MSTSQTAQQADAQKIPVAAMWRDREWTAPAVADWPWDVLEAIDEEKYTVALKGLLEGEQYKAFKKLKPTVTEGGELLEALVKAAGMGDSGE